MRGLLAGQMRRREQRDELLSAYLDGQLSAVVRARLEAQLAADPELRAELEALRRTVSLVRDLSPVPVPHNFILSQAMVARPRPARPSRSLQLWAAPVLTAATAIVSLLFVIVLAGDLLLSGMGGRALAPAAEPRLESEAPQAAMVPSPVTQEVEAVVEVEKAVAEDTASAASTEAPSEPAPQATVEMERYAAGEAPAGGGADVEETVPPAPAAPAATPTPAARLTPEVTQPAALGIDGGPTEESAAPAPTAAPPVVEEAAAPAPTAEPTPGQAAEAVPRASGEEEPGAAEVERVAPEGQVTQPAASLRWRILEGVLGLTALGLALATIWAWRARRR